MDSYETYNFFINTCNYDTRIAIKHITSSLIHETYNINIDTWIAMKHITSSLIHVTY